MPLLYPVVVGLTLITGCASNSAQLRQALQEQQRAPRAATVATVAAAAPKKAAPTRSKQRATKPARKPRERRNVWVPERLGSARYGGY
ncbi:MAG: hypothetical protein KC503_17745 [Myxococcales bacterium]|nr:hypothetical protein [Myxococcales bacterium]